LNYFDVVDIATDNGIKNLIISHINPSGEMNTSWRKGILDNLKDALKCNVFIPKSSGLEINIKK
jgi:hypothetical protein